jgi:hypothetical protein
LFFDPAEYFGRVFLRDSARQKCRAPSLARPPAPLRRSGTPANVHPASQSVTRHHLCLFLSKFLPLDVSRDEVGFSLAAEIHGDRFLAATRTASSGDRTGASGRASGRIARPQTALSVRSPLLPTSRQLAVDVSTPTKPTRCAVNLSVWEYLRRRTAEAVLAGFHDAFDYLERQDQPQAIHAAAKAMRRRFQGQLEVPSGPKPDASPAPHQATPQQPTPHAPTPGGAPVGLPQPSTNGKPAAPNGPANAATQRRRPGRPRKEVHG